MKKKQNAEQPATSKASNDANDKGRPESATTGAGKNPPAYRTKTGSVYGSVFLAKTAKGNEFPTALIHRRYKGRDEVWKNSSSYGRRDIADLVTVATDIKLWMERTYPEQKPK